MAQSSLFLSTSQTATARTDCRLRGNRALSVTQRTGLSSVKRLSVTRDLLGGPAKIARRVNMLHTVPAIVRANAPNQSSLLGHTESKGTFVELLSGSSSHLSAIHSFLRLGRRDGASRAISDLCRKRNCGLSTGDGGNWESQPKQVLHCDQ